MADLVTASAASPSPPLGSPAETRSGSTEEDVALPDECVDLQTDLADGQQVSRSPAEQLYDSLDGTVVEPHRDDDIDEPPGEVQQNLSTTYTFDTDSREPSEHESSEMCRSGSCENNQPDSQERSHPESWDMSPPGLKVRTLQDSEEGNLPMSSAPTSQVNSRPQSQARSHPESWEISQSESRGMSQHNSRSMSQSDSRGMNQLSSEMSHPNSRDLSHPDSQGSRLYSRSLSRSESRGRSPCQSCDSRESNSYMGPIITVVESDVDTILGEGDIPQVGHSKGSTRGRVRHDSQFVDDGDTSMPQLRDEVYEDDGAYEEENAYYDGCQYTVYGDPVQYEGTSTGENADTGPSFADDNESELERLSYDEEDDCTYNVHRHPVDYQENIEEEENEETDNMYYPSEQGSAQERPNVEGEAEEEDQEEYDGDETKVQQSFSGGTSGTFTEDCSNRFDGENMRLVEDIGSPGQNRDLDEYVYNNTPKKRRRESNLDCSPQDNYLSTPGDRSISSHQYSDTGNMNSKASRPQFHNENDYESTPRNSAMEYDDQPTEVNLHLSLQKNDTVRGKQGLKPQNPELLSRVELQDDSFVSLQPIRTRSTVSSKSSTRSTFVKNDDKPQSRSSDDKNWDTELRVTSQVSRTSSKTSIRSTSVKSADKPKSRSAEAKERRFKIQRADQGLELNKKQKSPVSSVGNIGTCLKIVDEKRKKTHTEDELSGDLYDRPASRLCFRQDMSASPQDDSPLSNAEHERNPTVAVQKKSVLENFKPIPVEKSSQLFIMHKVEVSQPELHPPLSVQVSSQSCDASYEDTSDSGPCRAKREQSGPLNHIKIFSGQRKHRLSSTKRNKRRSGGSNHNLAGDRSLSSESKPDANIVKHGSQLDQQMNSDSDIEQTRLSPVKPIRKHRSSIRRKYCEDVTALMANVVYHDVPLAPELRQNTQNTLELKHGKAELLPKDKIMPTMVQGDRYNESHNEKKHSKTNENNPNRDGIRKQLFQSDDQSAASGDNANKDGQSFTNKNGGESVTPESANRDRSPSASASSTSVRNQNKKKNFVDQNRRQLSRGQPQKSYREIFLAKKTKEKRSPLEQQSGDDKMHQSERSEIEECSQGPRRTRSTSLHHAWSPHSSFSSHGEENADSRFNDSPPHSPSASAGSISGEDNFAPRMTSRPQIPRPMINTRNIGVARAEQFRSAIREATKENARPTACRLSDSEDSKLEVLIKSPKSEENAPRPKLNQHDLSEQCAKPNDKPTRTLRRPSRLPVLRAPRPPPRPPPPPPELSPVPPPQVASQPPSDQDEVCSRHSQADSVDSGGDKSKYKPYTMKDYRSLRTEAKMGGLGPHRNQALIQEKLQKYQRQASYAQQVAERNRKMLVARLEKPKCSYAQLAQEAEQQNKASRRQKAIDYARTVSRPPGRGKDPQLEEKSGKTEGNKKGKRQAGGRETTATGLKLPPLTNTCVQGAKDSTFDTSSDGTKFEDSLEASGTSQDQSGAASSSMVGTSTKKTTENILDSLMDTSAVEKLRERHEQEKAMVKKLCDKRGSL